MRWLVVLCISLSLALQGQAQRAEIRQPPSMPAGCDRDKIINCLSSNMDKDHDGLITIAEFNTFLGTTCGRVAGGAISGESVMQSCDTNGDRALSAVDYDGPRSCMASAALRRVVCSKCDECERLLAAEAAAAAAAAQTTVPGK